MSPRPTSRSFVWAKTISPAPSGASALSFFTRTPSPDWPYQPGAGIVTEIVIPRSLCHRMCDPSGTEPAGMLDGEAATDCTGVAVGSDVDLDGPPALSDGPMSRDPSRTPMTTTAAAVRPMVTNLFTMGVLHGPMTTRCRFCSISARMASKT